MASSLPNLISLAASITKDVSTIEAYLKEHNLPIPSFAHDGPESLPLDDPSVQIAQMSLVQSAFELYQLALGPRDWAIWQPMIGKYDNIVINVLNQFDVFSSVPLSGSPISVSALAAKTGMPESALRRILRHAMTLRLFAEASPGSDEVVHTSLSATIARDPRFKSWIGHNIEECEAGALMLGDMLKKVGATEHPGDCAFMMRFEPGAKKERTCFDLMAEDGGDGKEKGWRAKRFGEAMALIAERSGQVKVEYVDQGFDWEGLGSATVVDVGGSTGHVSIELASKHPNLKCVVQDFPNLESGFNAVLPSALDNRVTFMGHNFFTPQPVHGADVYFLKHVLHDWSDPYASKIISNLVPALVPGKSRVIVMDGVRAPAGQAPWYVDRMIGAADLQMMVALSARERSLDDWVALFKGVDERFEVKGVVTPLGSIASVIEIGFGAGEGEGKKV